MISSYKGAKLVLIDPSYEVKTEYEKVTKLIKHNAKQFPNVCYMVWYPILESDKINLFIDQMLKLNINNTTHIKIELKKFISSYARNWIFIINAPSDMKEEVNKSLDVLLSILKDNNKPSSIQYDVFLKNYFLKAI